MVDYAHLEVERHGDIRLARLLHPKLTGDLPAKVGEELSSLAAPSDCLKLLLNLSRVTQMSSEMFGKLIMLNRQMMKKSGSLKLCDVSPEIRQILVDTRLDQVFDLYDTEAAGLAAFG